MKTLVTMMKTICKYRMKEAISKMKISYKEANLRFTVDLSQVSTYYSKTS